MIPVFLKEEDNKKADDIVQDRDLTKILKIEIKRIRTEDQFVQVFVVSDISKFFQN